MAKRNQKIIRYRKSFNLNIGMLIFAVIFSIWFLMSILI